MTVAALAALVGHCFPVWLRFRGGKGVATAAGMFLALCSPAALGAIGLFILVVLFCRYVSLGSISAAAAMPLLIYFLWAPDHAPPPAVTFGTLSRPRCWWSTSTTPTSSASSKGASPNSPLAKLQKTGAPSDPHRDSWRRQLGHRTRCRLVAQSATA